MKSKPPEVASPFLQTVAHAAQAVSPNIRRSCRAYLLGISRAWSFVMVATALAINPNATGAQGTGAVSKWVHLRPEGKLIYQATPRGNRLMDFSYAGYMGGGVALPDVPVKRTVKPIAGDNTAGIQSAIDEVSALPLEGKFRGAVLLAPGTYICSNALRIAVSGVVLRGSGSEGGSRSTLKMAGRPHTAILVGNRGRSRRGDHSNEAESTENKTYITEAYVPSGTTTFTVADPKGFEVGDTISIRKPVTAAWIKFMHMDDLVRDGRPQTWLRPGSTLAAERTITAISGNKLTVGVPLSDSYDAKYLNPPGTSVVKIRPPARLTQVGIENLRIESPPQAINHTQPHYSAVRMNGQDCWMRDVVCDETMNSVDIGGARITLEQVAVIRRARHQGSSKPAEFAPNGSQVLLDRCSVAGDNIWFVATGAGVSGPVVILNCTFTGNGAAESHQRWSTGLLYDNCRVPQGSIDLRNRGSMGSGHGWTIGWGVVWNCEARDYIVQNPPGALNWLIGSIGHSSLAARPFASEPKLPPGVIDSPGTPVVPQSLYLTQLVERLGTQALRNIGYASTEPAGAGVGHALNGL
jgi:hypothetical protein